MDEIQQDNIYIRHQKIDRRQPVFVSLQKSKLRKEKEELWVFNIEEEQKERVHQKIPLRKISQIVLCHKNISVTTPLLHACLEMGIGVFYQGAGTKPSGHFVALGNGGVGGRMAQYKMHFDTYGSLLVAKHLVKNKIQNAYQILRRNIAKEHFDTEARQEMKDFVRHVEESDNIDRVRGFEGSAARMYFGYFDGMIKREGVFWEFGSRTRQPPQNPLNALLGYGYGCLYRECILALQLAQLDIDLGFLHVPQSGRVSLALDLMEIFRAVLVDALVLTLINKKMIQEEDFEARDGGVFLTKSGRKTWIYAWEQRLQQCIQHPLLGFEMSYKRCIVEQAQLLKQFMMHYSNGEKQPFPLFLIR